MDATRLNAAVATLRKAGEPLERLDLAAVEENARLFGTGLSTTGPEAEAIVGRREEVRAAIEDLARKARAFVEARRALEELLG